MKWTVVASLMVAAAMLAIFGKWELTSAACAAAVIILAWSEGTKT